MLGVAEDRRPGTENRRKETEEWRQEVKRCEIPRSGTGVFSLKFTLNSLLKTLIRWLLKFAGYSEINSSGGEVIWNCVLAVINITHPIIRNGVIDVWQI